MRSKFIALSFASTFFVLAGVSGADAQYTSRGTYGTYGTGASGTGYGATTGYNGNAYNPSTAIARPTTPTFTAPATPTAGAAQAGAGTDPNSDYQQMMNAVNQDTSAAFGPPKSDDEADQQAAAKSIANQAANPYTANPTVANGASGIQPALSGVTNGANGYNSPLGQGAQGPYGAVAGTTGIGEYNNNPYATGRVTAPATGNSPTAPSYTGSGQ